MIPNYAVAKVVSSLDSNEEELLYSLGQKVIELEAINSSVPLARQPKRDLIQKAIGFLKKNRDSLRKSICPDNENLTDDLMDINDLIIALLVLIERSLRLPTGNLDIVIIVGAVILKQGIKEFCFDY